MEQVGGNYFVICIEKLTQHRSNRCKDFKTGQIRVIILAILSYLEVDGTYQSHVFYQSHKSTKTTEQVYKYDLELSRDF